MRGPRLLDLLVLGLSALSVAEANVLDTNARFGLRNGVAIQRRQQTGTGNSADPTTTSRSSSSSAAPPPPSSTSPTGPTNTPTPTPTPTPSLTPTRSSSSTPPPNTSPSATNTSPPSTTVSTTPPATTESLETVTSTTVITTTNSDGQSITLTSQTTSTQTAGLANSGKGGAQNGMTPETRNTIIGVVVGVGGAIILGGLAFVAWRIWGRKKAAEENDDLMDYPSTSGGEKPDTGNSMSGRTPFQSTLESYHAPTQVNSAANF